MKILLPLVLAFGVLAFVPGCDNNGGGSAANNTGGPKKLRLAFVTNTKNDFWDTFHHGCNSAVQTFTNVDLDFRYFTGSTVAEQQQIVSDLVTGGVDGIAMSPIDADAQAAFLAQVAAKTLLVCVDSDVPGSQRVCFIGTDNVTAGKQAADLLKAALPQGGKIVLCVGYPNAQNAKDRIQGLASGLAGSNLKVVDTMADATDPAVAMANAQKALATIPDLAGIVGLYSYNGPAILAAVRSADKAGKVKIVCFDDDSKTLAGVAAGDIYGTVVQTANRIGYETIARMDQYLSGDKSRLAQGNIMFKSLPVNQSLVESVQAWHDDNLQP